MTKEEFEEFRESVDYAHFLTSNQERIICQNHGERLLMLWDCMSVNQVAKVMGKEPSMVRAFIDACKDRSFDCLDCIEFNHFFPLELKRAIKYHGLDPVWLEYARQRGIDDKKTT